MSTPVYLRPKSLEEATQLLQAHPEAKVLAGGQSLLAAIKLGLNSPSHLIDIQDLSAMDTIRLEPEGLWIGAMVTHARIAESAVVRQHAAMLCDLAAGIADPQIRNMGTIGGALANNDPSACWPAGVLASHASVITQQRTLPSDMFFNGLFGTALHNDELVIGVRFPKISEGVYLKFEQPASRFAIVGVALVRQPSGSVKVAVTGLGNGVIRWPQAELVLQKNWHIRAFDALQIPHDWAHSDVHASAAYRVHLMAVLCRRGLAELTGASAAMPRNKPSLLHDTRTRQTDTLGESVSLRSQNHLNFPLAFVWNALLDPICLKACIPGCESLNQLKVHHYRAIVKVGLGPVSAKFHSQIELTPLQAPDVADQMAICHLKLSGQAGSLGRGEATVQVTLRPTANGTHLIWVAQPQLEGKLAQMGNRLIQASSKTLSEQFFRNFEKYLKGQDTRSHFYFSPSALITKIKLLWQKLLKESL